MERNRSLEWDVRETGRSSLVWGVGCEAVAWSKEDPTLGLWQGGQLAGVGAWHSQWGTVGWLQRVRSSVWVACES